MNLTSLDNALWAASLIGHAALLFVLLYRGRWRIFPAFTAYFVFALSLTISLFLTYRFGSLRSYVQLYWIGALLDILLQVAMVLEIARIVLRPVSVSVSQQRLSIVLIILGLLIASLLSLWVHPKAPNSLDAWEVRGSLFCSLLICGFFTAVLAVSQRLGAHWHDHAMNIGYGLTVWAVVSLVVDMLHGYFGAVTHFTALEHTRMLFYLGCLVYWTVALWRNEPERKQATPEMRDAILHLTGKVSYDLAQSLGTRGKEL